MEPAAAHLSSKCVPFLLISMFSGNSVLPLTESITSANISQKDLEKSNANDVVFTLVLLFLLVTARHNLS